MPPNHYDAEIAKFGETYKAAQQADISSLANAIEASSEASLIGVGSGGSYTVASLLCNLHEAFTGRVSRPSTPLEIICNPTLAASSPVFLISAEGKNPDILESLKRARSQSARTINILTNRSSSPLAQSAEELSGVTLHPFELQEKDGYLATNSLLFDAILVARAYEHLDRRTTEFPPDISDLSLKEGSIDSWLAEAGEFARIAVERRGLIVVHSPLMRAVAADLESKLSEAALLYCQTPDLRSFAHGRHLWLADRPNDCTIFAITDPSTAELWSQLKAAMPKDMPRLGLELLGARPIDLIAGLVAQMKFVSLIAQSTKTDPGRPDVQQFGRDLYYSNLPIAPMEQDDESVPVQAKSEVFGTRWPASRSNGVISRACGTTRQELESRTFRAIVFDYDGTLCSSHSRDMPPAKPIIKHIERLLAAGTVVGVATGRGDSIQRDLQKELANEHWTKVFLGLYNGGLITDVSRDIETGKETSEYLSHALRIVYRLKEIGSPIRQIRQAQPYQVSLRLREGVNAQAFWFVVADSLRQAGLDVLTVVHSKHSVDILGPGANKSRLIGAIIKAKKIDPYEIITIGDQGAWPGNDTSLLDHRFSLSVDVPSRRLDRGWKFAPDSKRDVDATLWYLERITPNDDGSFSMKL